MTTTLERSLARVYRCRGCGGWRYSTRHPEACPTCRAIHLVHQLSVLRGEAPECGLCGPQGQRRVGGAA